MSDHFKTPRYLNKENDRSKLTLAAQYLNKNANSAKNNRHLADDPPD
jgi:hypothetical protein